jgi:hypothetical protein
MRPWSGSLPWNRHIRRHLEPLMEDGAPGGRAQAAI